MKKLGILGGMGPESTIIYYKNIVQKFYEKDSNHNFPEITIETVNMYEMLSYCNAGDYDKLANYLQGAVSNLLKTGVDFIAMASNTPHVVCDRLKEFSSVPILSITEAASQKAKDLNMKKIAWLGTLFTMENPYFREEFEKRGIEFVTPNESERKYIDEKIANELEFGIVKDDTKKELDAIIERVIEEDKVNGIVMGCTELPLVYKNANFGVSCFDTMTEHIECIVDYMFR